MLLRGIEMDLKRFTIIKDKPPTSEKELENKARLPDDIADFYARGGKVEFLPSPLDLRHETNPVGVSHLMIEY